MLTVIGIVPRVKVFILQPPDIQLLPGSRCVVRATRLTEAPGSGKTQVFAARALDYHIPRMPPVNLTQLHLLYVVVPLDTLDDPHH